MRFTVTGATGLVGDRLVPALMAAGHQVTAATRDPEAHRFPRGVQVLRWDGRGPFRVPGGCDVVVHLMGERVLGKRWTAAQWERIRASRLVSTARVAEWVHAQPAARRPALVCANAVGYYGAWPEGPCPEERGPGDDPLARVCVEWQAAAEGRLDAAGAARPSPGSAGPPGGSGGESPASPAAEGVGAGAAEGEGARVATLRFGHILDPRGGYLGSLLPFARFAGAGRIGSGRQPMPWVHWQDVVRAIHWAGTHQAARGPYNVVSPGAAGTTQAAFAKAFARAYGRPQLPVPALALRARFGRKAAPIVLGGQDARPARLQAEGFRFEQPDLADALDDLLA